jgi:hypothetical protein
LDELKKKFQTRLKALGVGANHTLETLLLEQRGWMDSEDYCRIVAGIDMLILKFPLHPYREIRLGTTPTRFQDCASIQEVVALSKGLGMEFPELSTWCCIDELAVEVIKLCETGHEIEEGDSYAPYFMAMKLANKSKYSVSDNPHLHLFAHIVGCSRGSRRSKNAIMTGDVATDRILFNACILSYASRNFGPLERLITETGARGPGFILFKYRC